MKILIGYDGSECADKALIDLQHAGLPDVAEALLLTAVDVFIPPQSDVEDVEDAFLNYVPHGVKLARQRAEDAFENAKKIAERGSKKVQKMFPGWIIANEAEANTPHWAIIAKSEEWKPDLTVIGSQGRTALGRAILGSVSQKVLYETKYSVRIARGKSGKSVDEPVRLILGVDGSPDSDAMIETVATRNWREGSEVKLITAIETFHQYAVEPDVQLNRIRELQITTIEKLKISGLRVTPIITDLDPKHSLLRLAETWIADCIFLGAKGHRFFERFLLGSVSSSVTARAHCSVEVVRKRTN